MTRKPAPATSLLDVFRNLAAERYPHAEPAEVDARAQAMLDGARARLAERSHGPGRPAMTTPERRAMERRTALASSGASLGAWVPSSYAPEVAASLADDVRREEDPRYRGAMTADEAEAARYARDEAERQERPTGAEREHPRGIPAHVGDLPTTDEGAPALVREPVRLRVDRRDPAHTHRDAQGRRFAATKADGSPALDVRSCPTCWLDLVTAPPTSRPALEARRVHLEDLTRRMRSAVRQAQARAALAEGAEAVAA